MSVRDHKAKRIMLLIEQQRRNRQAHRDELDLAYAASRDPRPGTLDEYDQRNYQLVIERQHRRAS